MTVIELKLNMTSNGIQLEKNKHIEYIQNLDSKLTQQNYEYWLSEHLRVNGLYWGTTALLVLNEVTILPQNEVIDFVMSCFHVKQGGFGAYPHHDAHILSTLSALQILANYNALDKINDVREQIINFVKGLQLPNGSFKGDKFGEVDTRFVYTAISSLSILGELTEEIVAPAVKFILRCENFDGGFGMIPGSESHAAQVFTCLGTLAITDNLDKLSNCVTTANWLSERQVLPSGGLNGRPEKLPDVCYSWWVLSSLSILGKGHWINFEKLENFILECQDLENGGFSDRPDNQTDVYHTCFSLTGLSLINRDKYGLVEIDPVYCMPSDITKTFKKWKQ